MLFFEKKYLPNFVLMEQIHRGQIVKKRIEESNIHVTTIARTIGYNRTRFYAWYDNESLPYDIILKIGKVIHWDFRKDFPELFIDASAVVEEPFVPYEAGKSLSELEKCNAETQMWRERYYALMEEHNRLMKGAIIKVLKDDKK